jgi:hypothetical protein
VWNDGRAVFIGTFVFFAFFSPRGPFDRIITLDKFSKNKSNRFTKVDIATMFLRQKVSRLVNVFGGLARKTRIQHVKVFAQRLDRRGDGSFRVQPTNLTFNFTFAVMTGEMDKIGGIPLS